MGRRTRTPISPRAVLVAVLAAAIALRGRPNTRSFGRATRGLSTANEGYPLSDGATLLLTVSTMADRNLTLFGNFVVPDELTPTPSETVPLALTWLRGS